jgi:hypothetical protein
MDTVAGPVHRLSVQDVYRMVEIGVLDEGDRIELVEGVLVDMVPIGAEHDGATEWLTSHFARIETDAWRVRVHSALLIAGGYLLPDVSLVAPLARSEQPTTGTPRRRGRPDLAGARRRQGPRLRGGRRRRVLDRRSAQSRGHRASPPARGRLPGDHDLRRLCLDQAAAHRSDGGRRQRVAGLTRLTRQQRSRTRSPSCATSRTGCAPARRHRLASADPLARDLESFVTYDRRLVAAARVRGFHTEQLR